MGESRDAKRLAAEDEGAGDAWKLLSGLAKKHGIYVHGGSILEKATSDKLFNTTFVFDRAGKQIAKYRKIHLFDVTTPDGQSYRESATFDGGSDIVTYQADGITVGCTICYDMRFPELYQALAKKGAELIMVPGRLHAADRQGSLGSPAARPRDRKPKPISSRRPKRARTPMARALAGAIR